MLDRKQYIDNAILSGGWEPATTAVAEKYVKPGMFVLDVGANIGYYTLLMSRLVGPNGRVVAFEPMHEPARLISWHIEHNDITNAEIVGAALDEKDGVHDTFFNYSWRGQEPVEQHGNQTTFLRLDSWVEARKIEQLDFIKIDVDGYEARLLRGAGQTLRKFSPTMIIEVCDYSLRTAAGLGPALFSVPGYGEHVLEMLEGLKRLGYHFLWEEDHSRVEDISEVITRFDLSQRSINLIATV